MSRPHARARARAFILAKDLGKINDRFKAFSHLIHFNAH